MNHIEQKITGIIDSRTGTAHACGHHAQLAAMIGAALALADEEVRASLSGSVSFFAVPAEEMLALTTYKLLKENALEARAIRKAFQPVFQKEGYCDYIRKQYHI